MTSVLVYNAHLDTLGGGERVTYALMRQLGAADVQPVLAAPLAPPPDRAAALGFPTDIDVVEMPVGRFTTASRDHDATIWIGNGVPRPSLARGRLALVHFPMSPISVNPVRRAAQRWSLAHTRVVVYSRYVLGHVCRRWGTGADVIPPPVVVNVAGAAPKEDLILSVGRFFQGDHSKRQDVLLDTYAALPDDFRRRWALVLAGAGAGDKPEHRAYLRRVRTRADDLGATVIVDAPAAQLATLYGRASLYWHAAGYEADADGGQGEHFGLSVVEAMGAGAVPLVYADGGPAEVVTEAVGRQWTRPRELGRLTVELAANPSVLASMRAAGSALAAGYSVEEFGRRWVDLLDDALGRARC